MKKKVGALCLTKILSIFCQILSKFDKILSFFVKNCQFLSKFVKFWQIFGKFQQNFHIFYKIFTIGERGKFTLIKKMQKVVIFLYTNYNFCTTVQAREFSPETFFAKIKNFLLKFLMEAFDQKNAKKIDWVRAGIISSNF